jgi:site-specific recombinase XerC
LYAQKKSKPNYRKIVLRLPDLDHAKASVLNSLSSPQSRRNYRFAMDQFIAWYCSEPRLASNRTVVLRFRLYLESLGLASATINQRLAAVRRLAYEAADSDLLSPELAAGIRRVKGVKHLGQRSGNWLNIDQTQLLVDKSDGDGLRNKRDFAMISILLGCGLRRAELAALDIDDIQIRQEHWAIVDLVGKGGHVRTVPMPAWVKDSVDQWLAAAELKHSRIFRAVTRHLFFAFDATQILRARRIMGRVAHVLLRQFPSPFLSRGWTELDECRNIPFYSVEPFNC